MSGALKIQYCYPNTVVMDMLELRMKGLRNPVQGIAGVKGPGVDRPD